MAEPLRITVNKEAPAAPGILPADTISVDKEIATLEVRNQLFTNWTSVRIEQRVTEAFPIFQFECSEESPIPLIYDALQFVPGDIARAYIGGVPAVFGYVVERHVGFDAKNHAVRIIGCGDTFDLTNSSVPLDKLNGHDGKTWLQLAADLGAHLNVKVHARGAVDNTPFQNIQILPGEKIWDALERYAKMRNIVMGSSATGGLLAIGENPATSTGALIEGYNILGANASVKDEMIYKRIFVLGQAPGSNNAYGDVVNKQIAIEEGTSPRNRHWVIPAELADTQHGLQRRAMMEKIFTEGSFIDAQIKVQGWFKDNNRSNDVWRAGEYYAVSSPSLVMDGKVLGCAGCVYEQSSEGGTTTTLQMVNPIHMNGLFNIRTAMLDLRQKWLADQERKAILDEAVRAAQEGS